MTIEETCEKYRARMEAAFQEARTKAAAAHEEHSRRVQSSLRKEANRVVACIGIMVVTFLVFWAMVQP